MSIFILILEFFAILIGLFIFSYWVVFAILTPHRRAQKIINERRERLASLPELEKQEEMSRKHG